MPHKRQINERWELLSRIKNGLCDKLLLEKKMADGDKKPKQERNERRTHTGQEIDEINSIACGVFCNTKFYLLKNYIEKKRFASLAPEIMCYALRSGDNELINLAGKVLGKKQLQQLAKNLSDEYYEYTKETEDFLFTLARNSKDLLIKEEVMLLLIKRAWDVNADEEFQMKVRGLFERTDAVDSIKEKTKTITYQNMVNCIASIITFRVIFDMIFNRKENLNSETHTASLFILGALAIAALEEFITLLSRNRRIKLATREQKQTNIYED